MKVFRYPLDPLYPSIQKAPGASYFVHAGPGVNGDLFIWAAVEDGEFPDARILSVIAGTGHDVPDIHPDLAHIASWVDGPFVWHAFAAIDYGEVDG